KWAISGWKRLRERGAFVQPAWGQDDVLEMHNLASPVAQFVRECCDVGPTYSVDKADLYASWTQWCDGQGCASGDRMAFGKELRAAVATVETKQRRDPKNADKRIEQYGGIRLKPQATILPLAGGGSAA